MNRRSFRPVIAASLLLVCFSGVVAARELTFEDRVRAQEAIERVYYSHQIGATKPFTEAVPRDVLERKVRTYLKQSVALERFWFTPVTSEMLEREVERMVRQSRMPERLVELGQALGNDEFLIRECLARPVLVARLTHSFYGSDQRYHAERRSEIDALRSRLVVGTLDPSAADPRRTVAEYVLAAPERPESRAIPRETGASFGPDRIGR